MWLAESPEMMIMKPTSSQFDVLGMMSKVIKRNFIKGG